MSLKNLNAEVSACTRCELRMTSTQPVPGLGDVGAKYMIIGEAPGVNEDEAGIPFVGISGRRLNKLLALAQIDPNDTYITNVCKCRPPAEPGAKSKNRKPKKKEIRACLYWLNREIELVKPEKIITLGGTPLSLFTEQGVKTMHGTQFDFELPPEGLTT